MKKLKYYSMQLNLQKLFFKQKHLSVLQICHKDETSKHTVRSMRWIEN